MRSKRLLLSLTASALLALTIVFACMRVTDDGASRAGVLRRTEASGLRAPEIPAGLDWLNVERPLTIHGDLRGKVVLLDFWTLGCVNCQHVIPDERRLREEYGDALVVIGVHSGKYDAERTIEHIRAAVQRLGIEHPVVNDADFAVWHRYGVDAWPTLVLIDPTGMVRGIHRGEGVYQVLSPVLRELIGEFRARGELNDRPLALVPERPEADGPLRFPGKVLVDPAGGRLFIADSGNHRILAVALDSGRVQAVIGAGAPGLKDGSLAEARFHGPQGMALAADGARLYVADTQNHAVRLIDLQAGTVMTLVGGRQDAVSGQTGTLTSPRDVALWRDRLFIAAAGSHQIWTVSAADGAPSVFAGTGEEGIEDGDRRRATLAQPEGLAVDGDSLYWVDAETSSVRRARLEGGPVETLVGTGLFDFGDADGVGATARLQHPEGIAAIAGVVYVADTYNRKIRILDPATGGVTTLAVTPGGGEPALAAPSGLSLGGGNLYIADRDRHRIAAVDLASGRMRTVRIGEMVAAPAPPADMEREIVLAEQRVGAGAGAVRLTLTTPAGYRLNSLAPSRLEVREGEASVARFSRRSTTWQSDEVSVVVELPVRFAAGRTTLRLTGTIYYCRKAAAALCFVRPVGFVVPVVVVGGGAEPIAHIAFRLPAVEP